MAKVYILWHGIENDTYGGADEEHIDRAFTDENELIKYIKNDITSRLAVLSRDGYIRVPSDDEICENREINYAQSYIRTTSYYRYESCSLY